METAVTAYDPTLPAATLDLLPDVCMYLVGNMENDGVALWRVTAHLPAPPEPWCTGIASHGGPSNGFPC